MKRFIVFVFVFLSVCYLCAQSSELPKNRVSLGVGIGSVPDFKGIFASNTEVYLKGIDNYYFMYKSTVPLITAMYDRNCVAGLYLGWTFTYQYVKYDTYLSDTATEGAPGTNMGDGNLNTYTFMARMMYTYVNRDITKLYSGIELGISVYDIKNKALALSKTSTAFAYQGTLMGLIIGQKASFYMEVGYGYRGILNGGFMLNF